MKKINLIFKNYFAHYSGLSKACWQSISLTFLGSLATGICYFLALYFVDVLKISIESAGIKGPSQAKPVFEIFSLFK